MKKILFMAALGAAALSACSSEEIVEQGGAQSSLDNGAVMFSAYTARNTRASVITETELAGLGFGVYAFEQNTTPWNTYRASNTVPNFFYNQKVACDVETWNLKASITPTEYSALGSDAATYYETEVDGAHAVKSAGTGIANSDFEVLADPVKALGTPASFTPNTWDYEPHKYFSNNDGALHSFFAYAPYNKNVTPVFSKALSGPAIRYNAADDYDLLWGATSAADDAVANVDKEKQGVGTDIRFYFKHALSKVSFDVSYFNDQVHSNHDEGEDFLDENTTITVRSVKFIGNVPSQGLLNLYDGKWTYETTEESAYEVVPATPFTFTWDGADDTANDPKTLKENMMVIPTMSTDNVKIQIVYDVTTIDPTDPKNNSTITNTITSEDAYPLVQGTSYVFHLHLGITSVKFDADVVGWDAVTEEEEDVDLPNNK